MIGEPASAIFVIVQQGYVVEEAEWRAGVAQLQLHSLAKKRSISWLRYKTKKVEPKCSRRLMQQAIAVASL